MSDSLTIPLVSLGNNAKRSRELFEQWRYSELVSALLALWGLVTSTIDYELGYSDDRRHDNWDVDDTTQMYRYLTFMFTLCAVIFLILRHKLKRDWMQEKSPVTPIFAAIDLKMLPNHAPRVLWTPQLMLEMFILLLFPYPYLPAEANLTQYQTVSRQYGTITLWYTLSELLYAVMFLRILILLRSLFNYTIYMDNHARHCCKMYGVKANLRFAIKSIMKRHPLAIITILVLPSFFVFGMILRIFERPFQHTSLHNFGEYWNSVWCIAITMATIGYGDVYPSTHFGRFIAIFCVFWGAFAFSMLVVTLERIINLKKRDIKAFSLINSSRLAAAVVQCALYYSYVKRRNGKGSYLVKEAYARMKAKLFEFHLQRIRSQGTVAARDATLIDLQTKMKVMDSDIAYISDQMNRILQKISK